MKKPMHGRIWVLGLLLFTGCYDDPAPPPNESPASTLAQAFDPAGAGSIHGRVTWAGDAPMLEPVVQKVNAYHNCLHKSPVRCIPPHQPTVHAKNHGVQDVVVYLRGVDPRRSRPWDHPAVRIEFRDRQMEVRQGETTTNAAFVKRGSAIETVNHDADYHALRGRGADVFGLPLIKRDQPTRRTMSKPGIVDLTSGAGYYWQHAHLFVVEHPYYARTDADGHFVLDSVPAGTYELVCWMPSWIVTHKEIDPETAVIARLVWAPAKEQTQSVDVLTGQMNDVTFRWSKNKFHEGK